MRNTVASAKVIANRPGLQRRVYLALGLMLLFVSSSMLRPVAAADGDLDTTFGSAGKVTSGPNLFAFGMKLQTDDRVVVVGSAGRFTNVGFEADFGLVRYQSNGSLDQTFGSGGRVTTNFLSTSNARALAIQNNGKIVVAGLVFNSGLALARYNSDGSLDATFGSGGKATTDFGAIPTAALIQTDGRIVVAGFLGYPSNGNGNDSDFALARFNGNGSLDSTFGSGGKVITSFSDRLDIAEAAVLQKDGKIVAVGSSGEFTHFALARYNSNGTLDSTFGSGGKVETTFNIFTQTANAAVLQGNGKIIAAGIATNLGTEFDFGLARYNTDGSLDQTFGSGGKVTTDFFSNIDSAQDLTLQSDGKIVVAGDVTNNVAPSGSAYDFGLARYNSDGSLDTTFGIGGKVTTDFFSLNDRPIGVGLQNDGRIVVAGNASDTVTGTNFALARYTNQIFDTCLQDESNGNLLRIDSTTGDYLFTTCAGFSLGGTGTLIRRGSTVTLQHYGTDRRVLAIYDDAATRGNASIQSLLLGRTLTIMDRNTGNNTCVCP